MLKYLLIGFFFSLALASEKSSRRSAFYGYEPNVICNQNDFNLKSDSMIQCGILCKTNALCRYFRYDEGSKNCTGCHLAPVAITDDDISEGYYVLHESGLRTTITKAATTTAPSKATDSLTTTGMPSTAALSYMSSATEKITSTNPSTTTEATTPSALSTVIPKITSPIFGYQIHLTTDVGHHTTERSNQNQGDGEDASFGQSEYVLTQAMNFTAAQLTCNNEAAGVLALVETEGENRFLAEFLQTHYKSSTSEKLHAAPFAYIGAQINSLNNTVFFPSGEKVTFPYVMEFYPTTVESPWCIALQYAGIWHPVMCNMTMPGLCEKHKND